MAQKKSFWATLPGILTGIASVLVAAGGLIGIIYQLDGKGAKDAVPVVEKHNPGSAKEASKPQQPVAALPTHTPANQAPPESATTPPARPMAPIAGTQAISPLKVNVGFEKKVHYPRNRIEVIALSNDGKSVIEDGEVKITASEGFFSGSGSSEIKGTTESTGTFIADWYSHERFFKKGETYVEVEVVVTKDDKKGSASGTMVVIKE